MASRKVQAKAARLLRKSSGLPGQGVSAHFNKMSGRSAAKNYLSSRKTRVSIGERKGGISLSGRNLAANHLRSLRKG